MGADSRKRRAAVGAIAERLVGEHLHEHRFDNLRVIWAGEGKSAEPVQAFFDELTDGQLDSIELDSIDVAKGYVDGVERNLPDATVAASRGTPAAPSMPISSPAQACLGPWHRVLRG